MHASSPSAPGLPTVSFRTVLVAVTLALAGPLAGCAGPDVSAEAAPLAPGALTSAEGLAAYLGAASGEGVRDLQNVPNPRLPDYGLTVATFDGGSSCRIVSYGTSEVARDEGPANCAETYRANGVLGGVSEYGARSGRDDRRTYADEGVGRWLSGCHVVGSAHAVCWSDHRDGAERFDRALRALSGYADSAQTATAAP